MTEQQWQQLVRSVQGEAVAPMPVGFIIDSPWLPLWAGVPLVDYFASETSWLEANLQAVRRFPDVLFLPGFWPEYGMCTEPSAFGAKCVFPAHDLPFAEKMIATPEQMTALRKPDVRTDGLLPFTLQRLQRTRPAIEAAGHAVKFAAARGPLNIASFLMGTTELMLALKEEPEASHALLATITDFLGDWLRLQQAAVPTIEGILLLDDLVGFLGADDFAEFAAPYLQRAFHAFPATVRFFHNDAHGLVCAPRLADVGINLFNFSFQHSLKEMLALTGGRVTLLGNLPPRDVLAKGTPEQVRQGVRAMLAEVPATKRIIASCGGGLAPNTPTENLVAFAEAARRC